MIKSWNDLVKPFMESEDGQRVRKFVIQQRNETTVYPEQENVFRAFKENLYPYKNVKMVIIGQDPYHNGLADGLAFSCSGDKRPESLVNIFKELKSNLYSYMTKEQWAEFMPTSSLEGWAKQGVLLMNTVLTVEKGVPESHKNQGWESFTNSVVEALGKEERPIVFMLWGAHARAFKPLITNRSHLILESAHPSPLSAHKGFLGNGHFTAAHEFYRYNEYFKNDLKKYEIDLRKMFDAEAILDKIKTSIGNNCIPFGNAKERIEEVKRILYADYLWDIEYMFNFTTKI